MSENALNEIKILDLGHHIAGPYSTKLLADLGAEVIKVERPDGGDPARKAGPFPNDRPRPEASGLFLYLNNNKKSITINLKSDTGIKIFKELVKQVDALVENFSPRVMPGLGLSYDTLREINPGLVMTSISNFGQDGPYRDYKATDIVLQAIGGWLLGRGEPDREPVRAAGRLRISEYIGGMYAAAGTMSALFYNIQTAIGQYIDISLMETTHAMAPYPVAGRTFPHSTVNPQTRFTFIPGAEECKDGYIGMNTLTGAHWRDLCMMMGMCDWAESPDFSSLRSRFPRRKEIRDRMRPWLMERTQDEALAEGQEWRVPAAMIYSTEQMLKSPQHQAREYFIEVEHPALGKITQPGAPFKMAVTPSRIRSQAPRIGEHNEDIYCTLLGYNKGDLVKLRQADVI
ncbi:CaiB/BaiF CoA transferase family protein [Chloroflexota bacterium]